MPPVVNLIVNGERKAPASLALMVGAVSYGGPITHMYIYREGETLFELHGADLAPYNDGGTFSYTYTWSNVPAGTYTLWAGVQSNLGAISKKITVTIDPADAGGNPGGGGDEPGAGGDEPPPPPPPPPPPALSLTRTYVYDAQHLLCKTIDPETGATVYAYDAAGNLAWSASGLSLPDPANCNHHEAATSGQAVYRSYDSRNRLSTLTFPDGNGDQSWTYTPDGLPLEVVTSSSNFERVTNSYTYNRRRLLLSEAQEVPFGGDTISYRYDANGHLAGYSAGSVNVAYGVNALGQVTSISSNEGTHASGVSYHPNGAVAGFTYGDGVVRTVQQNTRQLPSRVIDTGVSDLAYRYDANGNVTEILDQLRGGTFNRQMTYDGLDRLLTAASPSFGGDGMWRYSYDGLDNLRRSTLNGVRSYQYVYDARNRLTQLRDANGATLLGLDYDARGNLNHKNDQRFDFDIGNRLREAGAAGMAESYQYDAFGRRARIVRPGNMAMLDSIYNQAGQLIGRSDHSSSSVGAWHDTSYIYLGSQLIATLDRPFGGNATLRYQYTDAQGTPVAERALAASTPGNGGRPYLRAGLSNVGINPPVAPNIDPPSPITPGTSALVRTDYTPYGAAIGKSVDDVGYTGHVMDAATGLTYMQQRYYDADVGRFLSVDPVAADTVAGGNFNRYNYANNNPYRFVDPDGRYVCEGSSNCADFDRAMIIARKAVNSPHLTSDERGNLSQVMDFIGSKDDGNNVVVKFGGNAMTGGDQSFDAKSGVSVLVVRPDGDLDRVAKNGLHEGRHALTDASRGRTDDTRAERLDNEIGAYRTQGIFQKAIQRAWQPNDPWTPSSGLSEKNILEKANESVNWACQGYAGGNCR